MKYGYEIYLDKLDSGNLVGTDGDQEFETKERAIEDAKEFIKFGLSEDYNEEPSEFRIEIFELDE